MKHAAAWLVALVLSAPMTPSFAGETKMSDDQTAIRTAVTTMTNAFMGGDIDTVMQSYEPGAAVMFEPQKPINDADPLHQMFTMAAGMKPTFTYSGHEVFVANDIGLHLSPWTMSATAPDGTAVEQTGLSVAVFRKQPDGQWKMVLDNPHGQFLMQH